MKTLIIKTPTVHTAATQVGDLSATAAQQGEYAFCSRNPGLVGMADMTWSAAELATMSRTDLHVAVTGRTPNEMT